jgi:CRISPR system Cascade subunit CasE
MYLSLIELAPDAEHEPAFWREVATPEGAHRALWSLFSRGPDHRRDFLFRQEVGVGGRPRFYALSAEAPASDGGGLWTVAPKRFAPKLAPGDRLRFALRASPTVKKPKEKGGVSRRHDLVMEAKRRSKEASAPFDLVAAVRAEGERWFVNQGKRAGFELASGQVETIGEDGLLEEKEATVLKVDGYRQHRLTRKGESPIQFSTVDLEGVLVVRDPVAFVQQVGLGFGPQRAFGCGLMMLRRA